MSSKVTYLLGAGASANAVPILNKFQEQLQVYQQYLTSLSGKTELIELNVKKDFPKVLEKVSFYTKQIKNNFSPDTYARKLFIKGEIEKLNEFKIFLSSFLVWSEYNIPNKMYQINNDGGDPIGLENYNKIKSLTNTNLDRRYDAFIGTLIQQNLKLNTNVSILSWNYDSQIEQSFLDFLPNGKRSELHHLLGTYHNEMIENNELLNDMKLIKLNGSASLLKEFDLGTNTTKVVENNLKFSDSNIISKKLFNHLIKLLISMNSSIDKENGSYLNFAWESDPLSSKLLKRANSLIKNSQVLVVIGYSFPNYNLHVDKQLLNSFISNSMYSKKKIYIQDFPKSSEAVRLRIKGLIPEGLDGEYSIELYNDVNQFLIPYELYN